MALFARYAARIQRPISGLVSISSLFECSRISLRNNTLPADHIPVSTASPATPAAAAAALQPMHDADGVQEQPGKKGQEYTTIASLKQCKLDSPPRSALVPNQKVCTPRVNVESPTENVASISSCLEREDDNGGLDKSPIMASVGPSTLPAYLPEKQTEEGNLCETMSEKGSGDVGVAEISELAARSSDPMPGSAPIQVHRDQEKGRCSVQLL